MAEDKVTFSFGKNWNHFIKTSFNAERLEVARKHLLDFMDAQSLDGKHFLDIGCGSGIHSLAAYRSGAKKIVSIDVDPFSIEATKRLQTFAGNPANWEIIHGSILDNIFLSGMTPADIVYSWGVLHHTGDLWNAIRNAAGLIKDGGLFYIAIYEKNADSAYWMATKKKYNNASWITKRFMDMCYVLKNYFAKTSMRGIIASCKYIYGYRANRGMAFWTDVRDWLGGWPYEPATPEEVTAFCTGTLGLKTIKVKTGEANVEYLFRKSSNTDA